MRAHRVCEERRRHHIEQLARHSQCIIHCYSRLAGNKIKSSTRAGKHHDHYFTLHVVFCLRSCRRRRRSKITRHTTGVLFHEKRNKNIYKVRAGWEFPFGIDDWRYFSIKRAAVVTARWILTWPRIGFYFLRDAPEKKSIAVVRWMNICGGRTRVLSIDWLDCSTSQSLPQLFLYSALSKYKYNYGRASSPACVFIGIYIYFGVMTLRGKSRFEINTHTRNMIYWRLGMCFGWHRALWEKNHSQTERLTNLLVIHSNDFSDHSIFKA